MPEEPEKSGQEPNLELPSLLGFGRRKKKKRKTDTVADVPAADEAVAEGPAPPTEPEPAVETHDPVKADPVPQARAGLAPATDQPKRKPPVPPPPAARAEPEVVPEPEPVVAPEPEVVPEPEPAPEPEVVPEAAPEPEVAQERAPEPEPERVVEPEPAVEPEPVGEAEPQVSRDTEETEVIENVPPQASVAAPVVEPPAEPVTEPMTEQEPAVAGGPANSTQQNRPAHKGRVGWNDEESVPQPVGEPVDDSAGVVKPPRKRAPRQLPVINPRLAVALTGGVVGLVGVALTTVAGRGCEVIRGVGSCGGIGLLALLVILVLEILLGAVLLKAWRLTDPTSTSFLGVGLAAVFVMLFLLQSLESVWMFLVIPLLTVATFVGSWLVTETLGESSIDELHR